jgi:heme exporter protein C
MPKASDTPLHAAVVVAAFGFAAAPFLILEAPVETSMGFVQKIFYFHVPCAWLLLVSTILCAAGSIAYLFRGSERGDRLAVSAADLAVMLGACVMVSGPLWARPAWGVFWTWDARLTSSLLLWLMMVAYHLARRYGGPGAKKLSAALALFAAADAPLVYISVNVWRTIHPKTTVVPNLDKPMAQPFLLSMVTFTVLYVVLLVLRMRLERAHADLAGLQIAYEDMMEDA